MDGAAAVPLILARALQAQGLLALDQGNFPLTRAYLRHAVRVAREGLATADPQEQQERHRVAAWALNRLAQAAQARTKLRTAEILFRSSLRLYHDLQVLTDSVDITVRR
jgi:hypothetical protein